MTEINSDDPHMQAFLQGFAAAVKMMGREAPTMPNINVDQPEPPTWHTPKSGSIPAVPPRRPLLDTDDAIIAHLESHGGRIAATHRALAKSMQRPASSVSQSIRKLSAAGVIFNALGQIGLVSNLPPWLRGSNNTVLAGYWRAYGSPKW